MKKLFLLGIFLSVVMALTGQVVIYEDDAQLAWDATLTYTDGSLINFLPGDEMSYEVFYYDYNDPLVDDQTVGDLNFAGTTTGYTLDFTFPERRQWVVGVRSILTDGSGSSGTPSLIAWSTNEEAVNTVVMGGPFRYVPLILTSDPEAPDNLVDQRY